VKPVCDTLGLARSNVHVLKGRPSSWIDRRTAHTPSGDSELLVEIRAQIAELPSCRAMATGAPVRW